MLSVRLSDSTSRNKTLLPSPSSERHRLVLELLVGKWDLKGIVITCYAGQDQEENVLHLVPVQHVKESIQNAIAALTNWG